VSSRSRCITRIAPLAPRPAKRHDVLIGGAEESGSTLRLEVAESYPPVAQWRVVERRSHRRRPTEPLQIVKMPVDQPTQVPLPVTLSIGRRGQYPRRDGPLETGAVSGQRTGRGRSIRVGGLTIRSVKWLAASDSAWWAVSVGGLWMPGTGAAHT